MIFGFQPRFKPCSECGASLAVTDAHEHVCERERWLDYQLFQVRDEIAGFDGEFGAYLSSARGRFEAWCAERERGGEQPRPPADA